MGYTLKASGIATNLVMCFAVDSDNATLKEFVSPTVDANKVLGSGVAASVATSAWKGSTRAYWVGTANTGFDYNGVKFPSGSRPSLAMTNANGWSIFEAYRSVNGAGGGEAGLISWTPTSDGGTGGTTVFGGKLALEFSSGHRGSGGTSLPTDSSTKYSAGVSYKADGSTAAVFYYGLESGSLAADGTSTAGLGFEPGASFVFGIGGYEGQGEQPATRHISCLFNTVLTLAQFQSLHNDWVATLFDTAGGAFGSPYYNRIGSSNV